MGVKRQKYHIKLSTDETKSTLQSCLMLQFKLPLTAVSIEKENVFGYCCLTTAVCHGDQLLDFFLPELVRSQAAFSTDPEVPQN